MKSQDAPVLIHETFHTSKESLWEALTKVEKMRLWFFDNIPSFKAQVGFKTQFTVKVEDREFIHLWEITEVIPNQLITYNWKYEGYPGDSFVTFKLTEETDHIKLQLSHRVVESFPDQIPEFSRSSCLQGWTYFINQQLKGYLS
ncbi:MAG: SRPBCC domain-containing protein [Bacteroidota bacterium]